MSKMLIGKRYATHIVTCYLCLVTKFFFSKCLICLFLNLNCRLCICGNRYNPDLYVQCYICKSRYSIHNYKNNCCFMYQRMCFIIFISSVSKMEIMRCIHETTRTCFTYFLFLYSSSLLQGTSRFMSCLCVVLMCYALFYTLC